MNNQNKAFKTRIKIDNIEVAISNCSSTPSLVLEKNMLTRTILISVNVII